MNTNELKLLITPILSDYFWESIEFSVKPGFVAQRRNLIKSTPSEYREHRPTVTTNIIEKLVKHGTNVEIVEFLNSAMKPCATGRKSTNDRYIYDAMANPLEPLPSRDMSLLKHKIRFGTDLNEDDCELVANQFRKLVEEKGAIRVFKMMLTPKKVGQQHSHEWSEFIYKQFPQNIPMQTNLQDDGEELTDYEGEEPKIYIGSDVSIGKFITEHIIQDFQNRGKNPDSIAKSVVENFECFFVGEFKSITDTGGNQNLSIRDATSLTELTQSNNHRCVIGMAVIDGTPWDFWNADNVKSRNLADLKCLSESGVIHPYFLKPCIDEILKSIKKKLHQTTPITVGELVPA